MTPIEILKTRAKELMHSKASFIDSIDVRGIDRRKGGTAMVMKQ